MKTNQRFSPRRGLITLLALTSLGGAITANATNSETSNTTLSKISAGDHRSESHIARNANRHPVETLAFFDIQPDMTVVEIWPGSGGWYTEILAPYLKDSGKLYAAHFDPNSSVQFFRKSLKKFQAKIADHPDHYGALAITALGAPQELDIAPANSADRVLTFRNVHNWLQQDENGLAVFQAMYKALKPGGILGVVEHRAPDHFTVREMRKSGYSSETFTIALAKKAGFKLLDKSELNANTKDTKDHPNGVWSLPPTLRGDVEKQQKYLNIGESDRMTLKFIKPL
ncbi:MAG: methyltransferase [Gammaproteobacteria bacterium]|nr:MAG: methyltransferase [Gammaproteobacteria bacterium]